MGYALHELGQLVKAYIAERYCRISVHEVLVNLFALSEPCNGSVLPVHGGYVRKRAHECVMTAHQRIEAELESLFEEFPELLLVAARKNAALGKIDGNDALVESALELVVAVFVFPGGKEGAAAHGREYVALVVFAHLLCRDIVGIKALGRALYGKPRKVVVLSALQAVILVKHVYELGECRGDVHAYLVLYALIALLEYFLYYHRVFFDVLVLVVEVHEEGDEGGLTVGRHEGINLVLYGLNACLELVLYAHVDNSLLVFGAHGIAELIVAFLHVLFSRAP